MDILRKLKTSDVLLAVVVLAVVMLIIIPLAPFAMDVLLIISITVSLLILFIAIYVKDAFEFSTFPTVLLLTTVFRMGVNLGATRLILSNSGQAGNVVRTFGSFVIGDNLVVGIIVFIIIIIIQFVVITRGAGRIAEVAARFTLDAMPGKQLAIDADLAAGIIDDKTARERRKRVQREADFFGAMDGASKFVQGDAIIGILTVVVNSVGGLIIGTLGIGGPAMALEDVFRIYTLATIGEGICAQLPALLISTATGIIMTRAGSGGDLGEDISKQMFGQPLVLLVTGGMLFVVSLIPGLPAVILIPLAAVLIGMGVFRYRNEPEKEQEPLPAKSPSSIAEEKKRKEENFMDLLSVRPVELRFGLGLLQLFDEQAGGSVPSKIAAMRHKLAADMGFIVPAVQLSDDMSVGRNGYCIRLFGDEAVRGEARANMLLAVSTGQKSGALEGIETSDPVSGFKAYWIKKEEESRAVKRGYEVLTAADFIAQHLGFVIERSSHELLDRQQVHRLVENAAKSQSALVDEVVPSLISYAELQTVLKNLLREGIPIRDMKTILETLGDIAQNTKDGEMRTELVRQSMKRMITKRYSSGGKIYAVMISPATEQLIKERVRLAESGSNAMLDAAEINNLYSSLKTAIEGMTLAGHSPLAVTSPSVRRYFKAICDQMTDMPVLSYSELEQNVEIISEGMVSC